MTSVSKASFQAIISTAREDRTPSDAATLPQEARKGFNFDPRFGTLRACFGQVRHKGNQSLREVAEGEFAEGAEPRHAVSAVKAGFDKKCQVAVILKLTGRYA